MVSRAKNVQWTAKQATVPDEDNICKGYCIDIRIRVCLVRRWLIVSFLCLKDFMYVQFVHKK